VLVKPFEPQQVISRVRDLIEAGRAPAAVPAGPAPVAEPPAKVEAPAPPPESPAPRPESHFDDYFERLDAAFAQLEHEPERHAPPRAPGREDAERGPLPTVEALLGSAASLAAARGTVATVPVELSLYEPEMDGAQGQHESRVNGDVTAGGRNLVADMFAALFAVEQGEGAPVVHPPSQPQSPAPAVTEALVDEVTRRVLERLAPDSANELVIQIVSEVAERLIREEITRIKLAAGSRQ
jgi:hypothetical protein